ncbi:kinase-like protein [Pleurotus eryngii]|uniref:Kinase-like protein n=1 Tax=Pleurotus eryngii TaxID=5323 RepID=A0A9P6A1L7_PLEER|nr:kinase-like protein [Pleurotus eryngii]
MTSHSNIISLYDFFLSTDELALYMVFDAMEGNLHQLIKARKGFKLAGGLVSTICRQIVGGLDHIHLSVCFHRDLSPRIYSSPPPAFTNMSPSRSTPRSTRHQRDFIVIVKITDFGFARAIESNLRFTEYVSVRWYRAPEVLLLSRNYSAPVDMWALGTVHGRDCQPQTFVSRVWASGSDNQALRDSRDPSRDYGVDADGTLLGGGPWPEGVRLAREVGLTFPQRLSTLFDAHVPH